MEFDSCIAMKYNEVYCGKEGKRYELSIDSQIA